jgi:hypothetical protein
MTLSPEPKRGTMSETATCPMEAVFGGDDDERYPCTYEKGHDGPHSYVGVNPPSVADLARAGVAAHDVGPDLE